MTVPRWSDLIGLMSFGEADETPFSGVLEVDGWYSTDDQPETLPNMVRVFKKRDRYRVETLGGKVLFIRGAGRAWRFPRSARPIMMRESSCGGDYGFGSYGAAIDRPGATGWRDRCVAPSPCPPLSVTYLGREAWQIEVGFPDGVPASVQVTIDAVTGMLLRWGNDTFGDDFRWTRLSDEPALADALFSWDGMAVDADEDGVQPIDCAVPQELTRSEPSWAARPGLDRIDPLSLTFSGEPEVFEFTEEGSFHLGYDLGGFVNVFRRRHSDDPWDLAGEREGWGTWTEGGWDWSVRLSSGITPEQLEMIRQQLRERFGASS